jgi:DNA-binding MarR family transcriptional regulator
MAMAADEQRRIVLHGLRLASVGSVDGLARRIGLDPPEVTAVLDDLARAGWVTEQTGRLAGWTLTTAGRAEGERLLALELAAAAGRPGIDAAYQRFLEINQRFLELCTRWQLVEIEGIETPNGHQDPAHDAAVLADLAMVHDLVVRISDDLTTTLDRFGGYRPRFEHAMSRLEANDVDWFTKPLIDSYHSVWFELHEDLLATLGRDRTSERTPGARTEGKH